MRGFFDHLCPIEIEDNQFLPSCIGSPFITALHQPITLLKKLLITQLVVYQANKVAPSAELWCNGSMPDRDSGESRFESSKP